MPAYHRQVAPPVPCRRWGRPSPTASWGRFLSSVESAADGGSEPGRRSAAAKLLSLVVPMHDEAEGLDAFFQAIDQALAPLSARVEIVCVDDGSRDDTYARLSARAE